MSHLSKSEKYQQLLLEAKYLIEGQKNRIGALANISALIKERFNFFWVGFYIVTKSEDGEQLSLGPFQGPIACYSIQLGKGVCGTSWKKRETIVVDDVEKFDGHIACSSLSKSEIVVPIFTGDKVWGVLDIDSEQLRTFDDTDAKHLEQLASLITDLLLNEKCS